MLIDINYGDATLTLFSCDVTFDRVFDLILS